MDPQLPTQAPPQSPPPQQKHTKNMKRKQRRLNFKTQLNNNPIFNLSDYTLTDTERDLLTKGLSYIPNFNDDLNGFILDTDKFIEKTPQTTTSETIYTNRNRSTKKPTGNHPNLQTTHS